MAMAARLDEPRWGARQWPMTREAWDALDAETARLSQRVLANDGYTSGRLDGESDAPTFVPNIVGQQLLRQLNTARTVLERAVIIDDPEVAIIGRRVTVEEADGTTSTYALVIPGEGDPGNGWIGVDSPVGAAILGRRVGEVVAISAPAGSWSATIAGIE